MYNNAIIQTSYKPYIPPPKKQISKEETDSQTEKNKQLVKPNDYSGSQGHKQPSSDSFNKTNMPLPSKININQVLIDFNSTVAAIGAPDDIDKEVKTYLGLVETQAQKDNPNRKIIVANLKTAADVLDNYISGALNKPSKVVKEWIDALLLQNIDFKADKNITKGAFESITGEVPQTAKLAEQKLAAKTKEENKQEQVVIQEEQEPNKVQEEPNAEISPEIEEVKQEEKVNPYSEKIESLIAQAETIKATSSVSALKTLSEAFILAQNAADKHAEAKIYSKIANVQNDLNNLPQALDCLNASTVIAYNIGDNELKAENHKQMGQIYDEAGYIETATGHYFASIGIAGELDDTESQADTLNLLGLIHTDRYEQEEAIDFYKDALSLAKIKKNYDIMSDSFCNTALTFKNAGMSEKALDNLKNAALLAKKSGNQVNLCDIYEQAGDLMSSMNYPKRAADLYKKSYRISEKENLSENLIRLREKLVAIK